ncbi:MAG: GntR family transcriptional regulator, partial [Candidatus Thioglobus sp.]|nr:GntR family transcriptional regulator [Candidatus Thioglobus sp.]
MDTSKQNTASQILDTLTNDIIQGEFSPGEKLQIKTLKDRYKVGTSPIREALSQLIAKDLVVS